MNCARSLDCGVNAVSICHCKLWMSPSRAVCDMNTLYLCREMSRQTESETVPASKCSLDTYGYSLKRTAEQHPTQFLIPL